MKQLKKGKIKGIVRAYGFPILFGIIFACMLVYFVRPSQIEGESKVIKLSGKAEKLCFFSCNVV